MELGDWLSKRDVSPFTSEGATLDQVQTEHIIRALEKTKQFSRTFRLYYKSLAFSSDILSY